MSREALAATLGVDVRTITNLRAQHADFPVRVRGRSVTFPRDACVQWYVAFKVRQRSGAQVPEETKEIRRRTGIAEMQIKEADAALRLGTLTTVQAFDQALGEYAARVRAVHASAPSRYARRFPELTFPEAMQRLQEIFDACEVSLQRDDDEAADAGAAA